MNYREFVANKLSRTGAEGIQKIPALHERHFPFQADLVKWALRRGKAAIFANTGLGKTGMELDWARIISSESGKPVLILAPLAVAQQTVREAASMGIAATLCRDDANVGPGVNVANYERLHKFDASRFGGVVLDESSIIKHHDAKTLGLLMAAFREIPFKLCATATPAPNDYTELGTHAEFLDICSRSEMLSEYFCHDGGETSVWRLKGHARKAFWGFVATWGAMVRAPSDLGYDDGAFRLPPLKVEHHIIPADKDVVRKAGLLFAQEASTLSERREARRASIGARVKMCADMVNADNEPWIVWCDLNAESKALAELIHGAVEVTGSDDVDVKEMRLADFASGKSGRVLVTKPSIAGFGLNLQRVAKMAFVGVTDSWESWYQAVRRAWRFGQTRPVDVHVFASELEGSVVKNLLRKEADSVKMATELSAETRELVRAEVQGQKQRSEPYQPKREIEVPSWLRTGT